MRKNYGFMLEMVIMLAMFVTMIVVMSGIYARSLAESQRAKHLNNAVILASNGYPQSYKKGFEITMTEEAKAHTFVAGGKLQDGKLVTSGGRVTGTTAIADSLEAAIKEAYRLSDGVKFEGAYRRSDIGQRALQALK